MNQLARQLPSHAFCLAALIILQPGSERALGEAFRCFAEMLNHVTLDAGSIDLAEEVSERLSSSQLSQMNEALGACPREGGDKLDGLRLKEAYALLREGKVEAAICLVNTLSISPRLENEVLRFYDEAGLSSGKVPILEQKLSLKLKEISRDSPSVAETLSVIHQLLSAEFNSRKSEATSQSLISLKAEVLNETLAKLGQPTSHALAQDARIQRLEEQAQRKEADCQKTLSSLRAKVEALTKKLVRAGKAASQTQIVQEATLRSIEGRSQKSEAVAQQVLSSLRDKVEALIGVHLKAGEELKSVKRAQDVQIQGLDEKFNKAEAATQQTLNILRGAVETLRVDLDQTWSQGKRAQLANEVALQGLQEQSQKIEAATQIDLSSLKASVEALTGDHHARKMAGQQHAAQMQAEAGIKAAQLVEERKDQTEASLTKAEFELPGSALPENSETPNLLHSDDRLSSMSLSRPNRSEQSSKAEMLSILKYEYDEGEHCLEIRKNTKTPLTNLRLYCQTIDHYSDTQEFDCLLSLLPVDFYLDGYTSQTKQFTFWIVDQDRVRCSNVFIMSFEDPQNPTSTDTSEAVSAATTVSPYCVHIEAGYNASWITLTNKLTKSVVGSLVADEFEGALHENAELLPNVPLTLAYKEFEGLSLLSLKFISTEGEVLGASCFQLT
jgi:hypothetical protein